MYQHPGVYVEEIPSGSRPIEAASSSTALIVGYATKGPMNTPTLLFTFAQYAQQFGGINDFHGRASGADALGIDVDYMGHAVNAFFRNGGSKAYIVRLAGEGFVHSSAKLIVPLQSATTIDDIDTFLNIQASSPGLWANGLEIHANANGATPVRYTLEVGSRDRFGVFQPTEVFPDVSLDPADGAEFVGNLVNGSSALIEIEPMTLGDVEDAEKTPFMVGSLTSGDLLGLSAGDIAALDGTGFSVNLNGTGNVAVSLSSPTSLADIAEQIQSDVVGTTTADSNPRSHFTCHVVDGRLVLTSGVAGTNASVVITAAVSDDAAATLLLDDANATSQTGPQAFMATFSNSSEAILEGGVDGSLPTIAEYQALLPQLRKIRDISIILVPGQTWSAADPGGSGIIDLFIGHAERMKNRMVIVDPAENLRFNSALDFRGEGFKTSTYAATYYPWVEVANPHYHPDLRPDRARTVFVAPSGFAAGQWARTDSRRGVWKAPAGLQNGLLGAANTAVVIGDDEQDQLNPEGVNCFRRVVSDIVVWGTRTLATRADPEWRYVPVRRTAMMIEESIYQGIQWAVFEPNDHRLWASLRLNIENFLSGLYRAGAFQGEKASDAYFVRCGLGDTMTQGDIDAGQVIALIGFAPLKPAEFVIVRIQQIVGQN